MAIALQDLPANQTAAPKTENFVLIKKLMPYCWLDSHEECGHRYRRTDGSDVHYECTCPCHLDGGAKNV